MIVNTHNKIRTAIALVAALHLSGCASSNERSTDLKAAMADSVHACSSRIALDSLQVDDELDSSDIRMLNWNIEKGGDTDWSSDLKTLQTNPNLMVMQEFPHDSSGWQDANVQQHMAFAPGYRTRRSLTGVMTISTTEPMTQCNLVSVEPWLRSPKATVITEYGLSDTDVTLLVVNIHAVNFTFGVQNFQNQIEQALAVLADHSGPIILSGDFNTWSAKRTRILDEMTDALELATLNFADDHRKRFLGQPLDHIYIRGLEVVEATTLLVDSSDHNPMSARFRL